MNRTLILLAIIILSGCTTSKRCYKKFPPQIQIETVTRDVTVYRDTTIFIKMEADVAESVDMLVLPCPEYDPITKEVKPFKYDIDTLTAESNLAIGYTWNTPTGTKLKRHLKVVDKDTTLEIRLESAIRERDRLEQLVKTEIHIPEPVKYVPFWSKLLWLLIGVPVGLLGRKIYRLIK